MQGQAGPPTGILGTLLRQHREERRLSQERAADCCDMDHSLLSRLESGKRRGTEESIHKIARGFGLSLRELDALLLAAGFRPIRNAATIDDEPEVALLYEMLVDDHLPPIARDAIRIAVTSLVLLAKSAMPQ